MLDTIIVGSGIAALSAAIRLKELGKDLLVVSKSYPTASQSSQAQGGINAVLDNSLDSVDAHIEDTIKSSHNIGSKDSIKYMCENGKDSIKWLDKLGVPFSRDKDGAIAQRKLGGSLYPRACYSSDYTGLKILHTLYDTCLKLDIKFLDEYMLLDLIVEDNIAKGVVVLDIKTTTIEKFFAKNIILSTGGYAGIYHNYTTNSTASTGDGVAVALKAGAKLSNMEFVQFHPTALKGLGILVSESARGEGGYLVTKDEKRFVDELKPRDIVAREVFKKLLDDQDVFLDLRHLGKEKILEVMPQEYDIVKTFTSLDLSEDLICIEPSAHYSMGGIDTNIDGKTSIKNLFAIGECANNHIHGANRLGGNSLLEVVTFALRTASYIANNTDNNTYSSTNDNIVVDKIEEEIKSVFEKKSQRNFYDLKDRLGEVLYKNVGVFRSKKSLTKALDIIKEIEEEFQLCGIDDKSTHYNTNLKEYLEFKNSLYLSKAIVKGALDRKESRGAHYREDFPSESEDFSKPTVITKDMLV